MLFFEVDDRGCVSRLAKWRGVTSPAGGMTVMASSHSHAIELYHRYRNGEYSLKRTIEVPGYSTPCKNIICEK